MTGAAPGGATGATRATPACTRRPAQSTATRAGPAGPSTIGRLLCRGPRPGARFAAARTAEGGKRPGGLIPGGCRTWGGEAWRASARAPPRDEGARRSTRGRAGEAQAPRKGTGAACPPNRAGPAPPPPAPTPARPSRPSAMGRRRTAPVATLRLPHAPHAAAPARPSPIQTGREASAGGCAARGGGRITQTSRRVTRCSCTRIGLRRRHGAPRARGAGPAVPVRRAACSSAATGPRCKTRARRSPDAPRETRNAPAGARAAGAQHAVALARSALGH
mmetsp:Transcript_26372/g.85177  ORF Transcript_26372/g.85177 Transcript_26372/m.85177 type:complete len:277 (+) Transcript_26372:341-1171(+)